MTTKHYFKQTLVKQRLWRPLPLPLRCIIWTLVMVQTILPVAPQLLADTITNNETSSSLPTTVPQVQMPPPAPQVTVNRTVPNVEPPSTEINFSTEPSDWEITHTHIFEEPLQPMGKTTVQDNLDLANALMAFLQRTNNDDVAALTEFLDSHPQSPWRASVLTQLGLIYRHTGWFSKALSSWEEAWQLSKDQTDPKAKLVGDRSVVELMELNARLGRYDRIEALLAETKGRTFNSAVSEQILGIHEGLWLMNNRPEVAFRCGPMALSRIRAFEHTDSTLDNLIVTARSSRQGISLSSVCDLANQLGMNYQMAKRLPGSEVILPAVVNWKVGHYAALIRKENGKYLMQDPTFGNEIWISQAVLDSEASGYFLVPAGNLPSGWSSVGTDEGKNVWGKGSTGASDPNYTKSTDPQNPQCPPLGTTRMAQYNFMAMLVSLHIVDTPEGYTPPRGPDVNFQVTYNQREANQPAPFTYSNLGQKWTFNWLAYIKDTPGHPEDGVSYYVQGGGTEPYGGDGYNSTNKSYAPDPSEHAILTLTSPTNYTRYLADGSKQIFSAPNAPTNAASRKVFLTQIVDVSSNTLTFTYDNNYRLKSAKDALGQVTTLTYGSTDTNNPLFYQITKVTDPFGRFATFNYDTNNELIKITDILGITSQFTYGTNDVGDPSFITSMTTPYGTTTFSEGAYGNNNRWLQATDPLGQTEREEYIDTSTVISSSDPSALVPTGLGLVNNYLQYRNTFFWDKKAMQLYPGDYTKATIQHWLHTDNYAQTSGVLESTKEPLEDRIWRTYPDQPDSIRLSTNTILPSALARVLDDGSSQIYHYQYNSIGKPTVVTDPTNRTTIYTYSTNNIDLLAVGQLAGSVTNTLAQFVYNTSHLPVIAVDAAGQTNFFGYNSKGQLIALTNNALNQTVILSYDSNGYLTNILGSLPGSTMSFAYDGYGRVRTVKDFQGYVITTSYDIADRPTNITYMDGTYQQIVYQNLDPILTRNRNGYWTSLAYDPLRHLTDIYDNVGRHTQFNWCGCGSLDSIVDPMGRTTSWIRDLEGRVQTKVYPDMTTINYSYETNTSRLKSVTDADNQTTLYSYFIDNNLKQVVYSNAIVTTPSVSFAYDTNYNRLLTMTDGVGTTVYSYYSVASGQLGAGKLSSVDGPFANDTITYNYDALGRVASRAINGVAQQVTYDALGRVTMVTNALGSFTNTYVGTTFEISTNFYPNGQKTIFSYLNTTNDERLAEILNQNTAGATLSKFDYTYDPEGQITNWMQQADAATPTAYTYQYDAGKQLLSAVLSTTGVGATVLKQYAYGYDLAGNRTSEQIGTGTSGPVAESSAGYNSVNQITNRASGSGPLQFAGKLNERATVTVGGNAATVDHTKTNFTGYAIVSLGTNVVTINATDLNGNGTNKNYQVVVTNYGVAEAISYDANGNMTNVVTVTSTNSYTWDAANRLISITSSTNQSLFTYDGFGRRMQIVELTNGVAYATNKFVWAGLTLAEQRDMTGATVTKRFFGEGEQVSGTNYFFTRDHLGSVREVMNTSGAIQTRFDYDPYGRMTTASGSFSADFGYAGMFVHWPSGLNLTLYRAYSADSGHWLSRDPLHENAGLNLYGYVANNPVNLYDPQGTLQLPYNPPGDDSGNYSICEYLQKEIARLSEELIMCPDPKKEAALIDLLALSDTLCGPPPNFSPEPDPRIYIPPEPIDPMNIPDEPPQQIRIPIEVYYTPGPGNPYSVITPQQATAIEATAALGIGAILLRILIYVPK